MQHYMAALNLLVGTLFMVWLAVRFGDFRDSNASDGPYFESSTAYDWGRTRSPKPNVLLQNEHCDTGFIFLNQPSAPYRAAPFMIFDNNANLVWMPEDGWTGIGAEDVTVQQLNGRNYMVYRHLDTTRRRGSDRYIMMDESYQVFMEIRPLGYFSGELRGLRITKNGGAIISFTNQTRSGLNDRSPSAQRTYESVFQEIDLESGELLFEWRAPSRTASINSIDKGGDGDYLVAGSFSGSNTVICVGRKQGQVLWQLGGSGNDFKDASGGAATRFSGNHLASFVENKASLVIIDRGPTKLSGSAGRWLDGHALEVELDLEQMVASVAEVYPMSRNGSIPSIQLLSNRNTLLSYDEMSSFREFSEGKVRCEVHFAPSKLRNLNRIPGMAALAKDHDFHLSKFHWVGKPKNPPEIAVDPEEKAVYVSWNGATSIDAWVLQSARRGNSDTWSDDIRVPKVHFETRIPIPRHSGPILRIVALDRDCKIAGYTRTASKHMKTTQPIRKTERIPTWVVTGLSASFLGLYMYGRIHRVRHTMSPETVSGKHVVLTGHCANHLNDNKW
ncbi:hypothetical protein ACCO45_012624 [Purpureocillium lilacinum]|uniref:Uncharacterized protein n=1 Tax=Purpureocillium lilacinum TaxID=33203 RepID=A0ACC4D8I7_PURLI